METTSAAALMVRLADPWLRDFPAPTDDEIALYRKGTHLPRYTAVELYRKRTKIAAGPTMRLFDALVALPC